MEVEVHNRKNGFVEKGNSKEIWGRRARKVMKQAYERQSRKDGISLKEELVSKWEAKIG